MRTSVLALFSLATFGLACTASRADEGDDDLGSAEDTTTTTTTTDEDEDDESGAGSCGDATVDPGEQCDLGDQNGDDQSCTTQCTLASCGDGLIYTGFEDCDDGNTSNLDDCVEGCEPATTATPTTPTAARRSASPALVGTA